jgi:hypothetical protein
MGLKTAHRLLKQCGSVARALSAARMEGMKIPATYQKDFEMAEKTFVYQRVFHRSSTNGQIRMVTLTPCAGHSDIDEEKCIGPIISESMVNAIALGDMDPITRKPILDLTRSPPRRSTSTPNRSSFYAAAAKPQSTKSGPPAGQKTLDTFFSHSQNVVSKIESSSSRLPLKAVTNTTLGRTEQSVTDCFPENVPEEQSKYFTTMTVQSSPNLEHEEIAHLATFTPTQSKRHLTRSMSTDSGEISSPASSAKKGTIDQLQSSPLLDDSPITSPTLTRPHKKSALEKADFSTIKYEFRREESDIEEDDGIDVGFLQQFAFQQTPVLQRRATTTSTTTTTTLKREKVNNLIRSASTSSNKKTKAQLQLHDEEEAENFFDAQTPSMTSMQRRTNSESSRTTTIGRVIPLKRAHTDH